MRGAAFALLALAVAALPVATVAQDFSACAKNCLASVGGTGPGVQPCAITDLICLCTKITGLEVNCLTDSCTAAEKQDALDILGRACEPSASSTAPTSSTPASRSSTTTSSNTPNPSSSSSSVPNSAGGSSSLSATITTPPQSSSGGADPPGGPMATSSNHTGAIAGGVVGGIAALIACVGAAVLLWRRRAAGARSPGAEEKGVGRDEGGNPTSAQTSETGMAAELLALREEVERLKQERRSPGVGGESGVEAIKREQTRVIIDEQLKAEQPPSYLASWENTGGAAESDPGGRVEGNSSGAEPVTGTADDYDPYSEYRPETRTDSGSSPLSTRLTPVRKKAEG